MKPRLRDDDDAYKRNAHAQLKQHGPVLAAFDNEPMHINDYAREVSPRRSIVHLATDHSDRERDAWTRAASRSRTSRPGSGGRALVSTPAPLHHRLAKESTVAQPRV